MSTFDFHRNGISSKKIAIVGAGLAGLFCAIALAEKNASVTVFEKRTRDAAAGGNKRSFSLTLSSRGRKALEEQGLWEEVEPITMPVSGRMCHLDMEQQPFEYSADGSLVLHAVQRSSMNDKLLHLAERFPGISVKYNLSLQELDEAKGAIVMRNTLDKTINSYEGFDLIIGADGANSRTRRLLHAGKPVGSSQAFLDWGYRELVLPKTVAPESHSSLDPGYLHLWPRKEMMMFALPNKDGTFGANFIFPLDEEANIFEHDKLVALLKDQFPDLGDLTTKLASDLMGKKTSLFFSQRSSVWHSDDRTVLIGDAAHSTVPFYGQGMNCAFEGVSCLVAMLDEGWDTNSLSKILKAYQKHRKPHTDKIADLSVENFDELRRDFGKLGPQAERMAEVLFHKLAPTLFTPLHIMISHGELGYRDAEALYKRQRRLARWLGLGVLKQACACWIASISHRQRHPEPILLIR